MIRRCLARTACLALILLWAAPPAAAQTEAELAVLRMFYTEKELTVVSATRAARSINEIADNITVVAAEEIRAMNAHSLGEVLARIPGVFVSNKGGFASPSQATIQGSAIEHVRVLVDGMTWNQLSGRNPLLSTIPVEIIDRIEVVKGPASSAWGSALGGVINVITKPVGDDAVPEGTVSASYGEADSQDCRAAVAGAASPAGYYLFAGHQRSDGLRDDRRFDNDALFGKVALAATDNLDLGLSAGYSDPFKHEGTSFVPDDITFQYNQRAFFIQTMAQIRPAAALTLDVMAYRYEQRSAIPAQTLGLTGEPAMDLGADIWEEKTMGINAHLTWRSGWQTLAAGIDAEWGELDQASFFGETRLDFESEEHRWAVYINDTFTFGRWRITPGIRYDDLDRAGDFLSPSLGIAYEPWDGTLFRAVAARGFNAPGLSFTEGGAWNFDPNPDLDPETVWSYQGGVETRAIPYVWAKLMLFYHDVDDLIKTVPTDEKDKPFNLGEARRQGMELELETAPYHGVSLLGSIAYIESDGPDQANKGDKRYSFNTGARYGGKGLRAELFGRYVWWDQEDSGFGASYDDMIVDFNVSYRPDLGFAVKPEIFATVHNLFNGDHYSAFWKQNPDRWGEIGLRLYF